MGKKINITLEELKTLLLEHYSFYGKFTSRNINNDKKLPGIRYICNLISNDNSKKESIELIYNFCKIDIPENKINIFSRKKYTISDIQKTFEKEGCELLTFELPDGVFTKVAYRCNCGNLSTIKISDFIQGHRCDKCGSDKSVSKRRTDFDNVKFTYDNNGCKLLSEETDYKNGESILKYICNCGNKDEKSYIAFKLTPHCPNCNKTISGENHYSYKGGITPIHEYLRRHIYTWKEDSIKYANKQCVITGCKNKKLLVVHHTIQPFSEIMDETLKNCKIEIKGNINEYTSDELSALKTECLRLHYFYGLGITINKNLHNLFHSKKGYGNLNNTIYQFLEFVNRLKDGEFDSYLNDNNLVLNINQDLINKILLMDGDEFYYSGGF